MFEIHPVPPSPSVSSCSPILPHFFFLFPPQPSHPLPTANPFLYLTRAGLRADVQTLSFRLRPRCQLSLLSLVACPGSFFPLSPSSCGERRPYKAAFLLIHFCQFQRCHSNQCAGEWRVAELAASLAARTVLLGPSFSDVSTASQLF